MIDHAEESYLKQIDMLIEQQIDMREYCVAIFDIDDPFTPDVVVEQLLSRDRGYAIAAAKREELSALLRSYKRPVEETGAIWSPKGRVWLVENKVAKDVPTWSPYTSVAKEVLEPTEDVMLVTFVNNSVLVSTINPAKVRAHRDDVNAHNAAIIAKKSRSAASAP